ncbi:VCBS repeat-containing protein [Paraglaciecola sp. 20A4]|uniref:FG-GAP repeat domain-containing protein n=1 Tax=Paraglaciecola sp. 20A4 TaxID=2687288 RepID=UPI001F0E8BEC|nr:VCBS repeat-containing protein [Paraglaciecola sp. 20A4]
MTGNKFKKPLFLSVLLLLQFCLSACGPSDENLSNITVTPSSPVELNYEVTGSKTKKLTFEIDNPGQSANFSLFDGDKVLVDNLNISHTGSQTINVLVKFSALGQTRLTLKAINSPITINSLKVEDAEHLSIPQFKDISVTAGLDKVNSIKYGGPSVADIDQDGDYDFIVNNHNAESSKIYWNNGDGTVTKYKDDLSRWFMQDLHGTALGDYDNDGDLDMVLTRGGGNGTAPSVSYFYQNDNSNFVRYTGDVGIDRGARGRGARYSDMDLDGDLDLMLVNETGLNNQKPQHFFYENNGQGGFTFKSVPDIQDVRSSRA